MADPSPPSHVWFALALISLIAHWEPVHTVLVSDARFLNSADCPGSWEIGLPPLRCLTLVRTLPFEAGLSMSTFGKIGGTLPPYLGERNLGARGIANEVEVNAEAYLTVPHRIVPLASASSGGSRGKLLFLISYCLPLTSNSDCPGTLNSISNCSHLFSANLAAADAETRNGRSSTNPHTLHPHQHQHQDHLHPLASPPILLPGLLLYLSSEAGLLLAATTYTTTTTATATATTPHHLYRNHGTTPSQNHDQQPAIRSPSRSLYLTRPPGYLQMYDLARATASAPAPIPAPAPTPGCPAAAAAAAPAFCRRLRRCCCPRVLGMNE
ncbi:hypothetical protein GQ607_000082 [Colletotrichum asianum]|uniref:Uncharacterized protein n=1 Tax=Colletotrichum asianum TaxID=702518 RepID=A0A8H3ZXP5_9PEZI|nr:hypothetical protein GQ607_000082 [Colletotrichum asianum]